MKKPTRKEKIMKIKEKNGDFLAKKITEKGKKIIDALPDFLKHNTDSIIKSKQILDIEEIWEA
jgi:hypothetical protein